MPRKSFVRRNEYRDSVQLMLAASQLQMWPDIQEAILMMGTPSNKEFLRNKGMLSAEDEGAAASDLIIAVDAEAAETLDRVERELESLFRPVVTKGRQAAPVTLDAAVRQLPGANLCVISVPGIYAAAAARSALRAGMHVLVYSDNVTPCEERETKEFARSRGLLCMGPDCGVVNLNGVALALGSVVRKGPIGLIGASGVGIQEISILADRDGVGTSQAIGLGGRDLDDSVGGITGLMALDCLEADAGTELIVLIAPSAGPSVLRKLADRVGKCMKPVVVWCKPTDAAAFKAAGSNVCVAENLEHAAALAVALATGAALPARGSVEIPVELLQQEMKGLKASQQFMRGLFCGGTFLKEAARIVAPIVGRVYSNVPLSPEFEIAGHAASREHTLLDYGAEEFTAGRPHPVIDPQQRLDRLAVEVNDPEVAVILLDIVLGPALHPDPAGILVDIIIAGKKRAAADGRYLSVVASVCGSESDPQVASKQEEILRSAGVLVFRSNAEAARFAAAIVQRGKPVPQATPVPSVQKPLTAVSAAKEARSASSTALFEQELKVVNVGLSLFADALNRQGVPQISLDWRPPAGGDPEVAALLAKMGI